MRPQVWQHSDREGYVHDDTGVHRVHVGRHGVDVECITDGPTRVTKFADGTSVVGSTHVRIDVVKQFLRSPTLRIERVGGGA